MGKKVYKNGKLLSVMLVVLILFSGCEKENFNHQQKGKRILKEESEQKVPNKYIVVFSDNYLNEQTNFKKASAAAKKEVIAEEAEKMLNSVNKKGLKIERIYTDALTGFVSELSQNEAKQLASDEKIAYIEQDRTVVLGPPPGKGPNQDEETKLQSTPWGITRVGGVSDGTGKTGWIIDTGIDLDHPDLNVDITKSETFILRGKDSKDADDNHGHGTHVAGTVAAIDNDRDVVGVAAGATVVAVKILDHRGMGTLSGVIAGIDYVAKNAIPEDAANLSLGGSASKSLDDAVKNLADQGVFVSIAAGNDGEDANNYSPARVEYQNIWTVSASDINDEFAYFSNWSGPFDPPIECAAPGVDVLSLWKEGGTHTISGTSMSAPHVTGLLLITGGSFSSDGNVTKDPDGDPDPIAFL